MTAVTPLISGGFPPWLSSEILHSNATGRLPVPPEKTDPSMHGIARGIDEVLRQNRTQQETLDGHSLAIEDIRSQGRQNKEDIRVLKRAVDEHGRKIDDLTDRTIELERERIPRPPRLPSEIQESLPPIEKLGKAMGSGTNFMVSVDEYAEAMQTVGNRMESMRVRLGELEHEREIEKARADGAEKALRQQEEETGKKEKKFDRRFKLLAMVGSGLATVLAGLAYVLTHFLHL